MVSLWSKSICVTCKLLMSVYFDMKSLYPHLKVNWNMLMCKICIARRLVVDIFPWCNANSVPFPSGTLVARRIGNGSILHSFHPSRPGNLSRLWSQLANALPNHSIHNSTVNSATQVFCHANQCDAIRQLSQQNQDGRSRGRTCGRTICWHTQCTY